MMKRLFLLMAVLLGCSTVWADGVKSRKVQKPRKAEVVEATTLKGDVNGDKKVDVNDVTFLVDIILGRAADTLGTADVNNDKKVDVNDVTYLVDIILGRVPEPSGHEVDEGGGA